MVQHPQAPNCLRPCKLNAVICILQLCTLRTLIISDIFTLQVARKNSEGEDSYESCLGVARATVRGLELCRQINLTIYRMQKVAKI